MSVERLDDCAGRPEFALSIRARLLILATIALLPLLADRTFSIERHRAERIEAASGQALMLARQGMAAQNEALVATRALLQIAAASAPESAHDSAHCNIGFLTHAVEQAPWLKAVSLVDASGRVACSSNPDAIGLDLSDRSHFKRAMTTGEFALGDYFVSPRLGPTLGVALPHRGPGGAVDLLVTAVLELSWFDRVASAFAESRGAVVLMFDGTGTLIARQPSSEHWLGRRFDHPMIAAMLKEPEGTFIGECLDGVRRIFGFTRLPGSDGRLAVGLDESDLLGRAQEDILMSFAGFSALVALVLLGIWFGGERLFGRPIRSLARMAQRVGNGEFGARATQLPWAAEFIPLAAALDDMAGQVARRERELRESNTRLQQLAYADALTGIANRRAFNAHLKDEWQLACELRQPLAVLLIDVDHFKLFNDRYGHLRGDACLKEISKVLIAGTRTGSERGAQDRPVSLHNLRRSDFTARYGGEEFAILLQCADLGAACKVGERLRRAVESLRIVHAGAANGFVSISIGAASIVPVHQEGAQALLERADAALYEAKRNGRNRVTARRELEMAQAS